MALETRFGAPRQSGVRAHGKEEPARRGIYALDVDIDRSGDKGERRCRAVAEESRVVSRLLRASGGGEGGGKQAHPGCARCGRHRLIVAAHPAFVEARVARLGLARSGGRATLGGQCEGEGDMDSQHTLIREGVIAGALGATAVALWFLIIDVVAGQPLFTPSALGAVLAGDFSSASSEVHLPWVIGYTIFHFVAFLAVGLLLSFVAHRAEQEPSILAETRLPGALAWYRVAGGNLVAAVVMGSYMWKGHRALPAEFANALGARE
jgi:hypothetical protein